MELDYPYEIGSESQESPVRFSIGPDLVELGAWSNSSFALANRRSATRDGDETSEPRVVDPSPGTTAGRRAGHVPTPRAPIAMERNAQCPVCTLYLREGITLDVHLDTHPKDQVIRALCALARARSPPPPPRPSSSLSSSPFFEAFPRRRVGIEVATAALVRAPPPPPTPSPAPFSYSPAFVPSPPLSRTYEEERRRAPFTDRVPAPSRAPPFGGVVVLQTCQPPQRASGFRIISDVKIEPHVQASDDSGAPRSFLGAAPTPRDAFSVIRNVGNPPEVSAPPSPEKSESPDRGIESPPPPEPADSEKDGPDERADSIDPLEDDKREPYSYGSASVSPPREPFEEAPAEPDADDASRYAWSGPPLADDAEFEDAGPAKIERDYVDAPDLTRRRTFPGGEKAEPLNIRSDERMPPRGELSEQESTGDADAPWAFRDMGGSTSYDILGGDAWPSDGSEADAHIDSPGRDSAGIEDNPIVVSVKPPEKNYKCATCGKAFDCPKERRVHRTKEHPSTPNIVEKRKRKQTFDCGSVSVKKETYVKTEVAPIATHSSTDLVASVSVDVPIEYDPNPNTDVKVENEVKVKIVKVEKRKRGDYVCAICKTDFLNDTAFHEHLKIHPLECTICGKLFNRRSNLQLHLKRHLGIKNYKCDGCGKAFITRQKMLEHRNVHTGEAPVKCNLCDLTFRRYSNMAQHRNRHHLKVKKKLRDYICACGEVFHSKKKLAWHKEIHDDKPKACLHCNEKFVHVASLTRHMRRAHNNYFVPDEKRINENVPCPVCNQVYLKSSIEAHMKTHAGDKPHACVICNKNFTTKWNLKLHKWTHANRSSKPFKCKLCKGAFVRQADYTSHMNSHKSIRPYTCNYCGCQFIRKYNCLRHVKEHENKKMYACQVPDCGKSFHRSYYLTEHLKVHSGVRPYSCNICGKTSGTKSNHNKHIKIHHAREPVTTEG